MSDTTVVKAPFFPKIARIFQPIYKTPSRGQPSLFLQLTSPHSLRLFITRNKQTLTRLVYEIYETKWRVVGFSRIIQKHWYECENAHSTILYKAIRTEISVSLLFLARRKILFLPRNDDVSTARDWWNALSNWKTARPSVNGKNSVYVWRSSLFRQRPSTPTTKLNSFRFW